MNYKTYHQTPGCNINRFEKKRIYIVGSVSEPERLEAAKTIFNQDNCEIVIPDKNDKMLLEELFIRGIDRIKQADVVYVLHKRDGSIGVNTTWEKCIAISLGKETIDLELED